MTGKKGNIIPEHKKNSKQIVNKYRPVSLLPIFCKTFKKQIFGSIYDFIDKNNLFSNSQSGFRRNDSCIHQLIAITHNIFSAFDANPSLYVYRVCHDGPLYKLKSNEIDGNLFKLIKSFLIKRCQVNELFSMINLQSGKQLRLVCRKLHYFSSFTLMIFL